MHRARLRDLRSRQGAQRRTVAQDREQLLPLDAGRLSVAMRDQCVGSCNGFDELTFILRDIADADCVRHGKSPVGDDLRNRIDLHSVSEDIAGTRKRKANPLWVLAQTDPTSRRRFLGTAPEGPGSTKLI